MSREKYGEDPDVTPGTSDAAEGSPEKKHLFDDRKNVKRVIAVLFLCCAVIFLADAVFFFENVGHKHLSFEDGAFPIEGWFGFYGVYGFVACVLLVLAAKQMRKVLMREADYYGR